MAYPSSAMIKFSGFLLFIGLVTGTIASLYWDTKLKELPRRAFSTEEIAKTRRLSRSLHRAEIRNNNLETEVALLNLEISKHQGNLPHPAPPSPGQPGMSYEELANFVGMNPKSDLGIEITLQDSTKPVYFGPARMVENPNLGIVHNVDLILLLNQLWAAGAKAIAINQQRISSKSDISCAGPIIMVNKSRISSPFTIQVIGSTEKILHYLNSKESYLKYLSSYGIPNNFQIKYVTLPAYSIQE
jgi:uncharacterized protein YlxW (UPF0749 family)